LQKFIGFFYHFLHLALTFLPDIVQHTLILEFKLMRIIESFPAEIRPAGIIRIIHPDMVFLFPDKQSYELYVEQREYFRLETLPVKGFKSISYEKIIYSKDTYPFCSATFENLFHTFKSTERIGCMQLCVNFRHSCCFILSVPADELPPVWQVFQ